VRAPIEHRIVPATDQDLAAISTLAGAIWRTYYPAILSTEQIEYMLVKMYSHETLRRELQSGIECFRLFTDDEFIGFASIGRIDSANTFKLHKLYLSPHWHRLGLGKSLLKYCECRAQDLGGTHLVLNVNKQNQRAIAVYRNCGFQITDSLVIDIGNGFVMDDFVMEKRFVDGFSRSSGNP
jgi:diamine N-acetyltransferase